MIKIFTRLSTLLALLFVGIYVMHPFQTKREIDKIRSIYKRHIGKTKQELKKIPKKDRPDLAKLQDYLRTADPATGMLPKNAKILANIETWDRVQALQYRAAIPGVEWSERGPNNVGGRTRAIMYDPNDAANGYKKVWAGGVAGGLWVTNDITQNPPTWQNIDDFWENIAISSIAYDPSNTNIFYVATGEPWFNVDALEGGGVWKTTDGGNTWTRLNSTTAFTNITKIVVANNGNVILGDRQDGLQVSTDGGATWTQKTTGWISDIEIASDGTIYAAKYLSTGFTRVTDKLYRSTNNGSTFTDISAALGVANNGERIELAIAPSDPNTIYAIASDHAFTGGGAGNIQWFKKTTNAGTSWSNVNIPVYLNQSTCANTATHFTRGQAWYDLILAVNPTNPNHVLAGGIDVHRTTDGGTTWSSITYWTGNCKPYVHADIHAFAYKPGTNTQVLVGCDGGIFYSNNITSASPTFQQKNTGYNVTQFYSVAMSPGASTDYLLGGAQDNGSNALYGTGIQPATEVTGGDGAFAFIDQDNPCTQITSYTNNVYYVSTNGGQSFGALGTQDQSTGDFINPADYDDANNLLYSSAAYHTGGADVARWTVPAGARSNLTITAVGANIVTHIKVSPYSPGGTTTLYVGTDAGQVIRIPNAHTGTSFAGTNLANATMLASGSVSCIEFGTSENEIIVTYSNYGVQNVWYSNNGGTTWTSKDNGHGLPNMPVRWALFNPNDTRQVLLATETGVWSTSDITAAASGTFWQPSVTGLANTRCDMLQIRSSDNLVAIGTHGRGFFTTSIFGTFAKFSASKDIAYLNQNITFEDMSGGATSWSWNFGAGATPATANTKGPHTVSYSTAGTKTITLTINGSLSFSKTIYILPDRPTPYALTDGGNFETNPNDFVPDVKPTSNPSGCGTFTAPTKWERGNSAIAGKNGTNSGSNAWVTALTANYQNSTKTYLYSPNFDFSTTGCTYTLSFYLKMNVEARYDGMFVEYSTDKGNTWTKLNDAVSGTWYNNTTQTDAPADPFGPGIALFTGSFANYTQRTSDVSFLAGNANVAFRFYFASDFSVNGAGVAMDDFTITKTGCPVSPTITLGAISPTTYCAGATISVPFSTTGTFNAGNTFTAQLSDATGSFTTPIATATGTSPINLTIPTNATSSSNYLIRVVSSDPVVVSNLSPNITINALPSVTLTSDDADNSICLGTPVTFTATAGYSNYNFRVNGMTTQNGASNTFLTSSLANNDVVDVIVTDANGCSNTSSSITMTVISAPEPTNDPSAVVFSSLTGTSAKIEWQPGDGTGRVVILKANSAINASPLTDNTVYNANATFGMGDMVDGGYVVYTGSGSNVTVSGLTMNTLYYIAVFEYNEVSCRPTGKTAAILTNYKQGSPATGFLTTNTTWTGIFTPMSTITSSSMNYPMGSEPDKLIDNNMATEYLNTDITGHSVTIDAGTGVIAKRMSITTGLTNPENDVTLLTLAGSNDGITFTNIITKDIPMCLPDRAYNRYFDLNNSTSYRYYRITIDNVFCDMTPASASQITELQLYQQPTPLPLTFLQLQASLQPDLTTKIQWNVTNEQDIRFYEIHKTYDFNSLQVIGQVQAQQLGFYQYLDNERWTKPAYYRVLWSDYSGNTNVSEWVEVNNLQAQEIRIFPNPVKQRFSVFAPQSIKKLELYNLTGQKVCEWDSIQPYYLLPNTLPNGHYMLAVHAENLTWTKILIQR